jgi:hypothetical protein
MSICPSLLIGEIIFFMRFPPLGLWLLLTVGVIAGEVQIPDAAEWLPDSTLTFTFPDLPADRQQNPASFKIRLPNNYSPDTPMPVLVWFGGGEGSNDPDGVLALVDTSRFAVTAMPYPSTLNRPKFLLGTKEFDKLWDYHQPMEECLRKKFPNLHPTLRIAGGMSNGAHVTGTYLARGYPEFIKFFHAFVVIEGGARETSARKPLRNKYAYLAWGDADGNSRNRMQAMASCTQDARLKVTSRTMPGVGHGFPGTEQKLVREWIDQTVVPALDKTGTGDDWL